MKGKRKLKLKSYQYSATNSIQSSTLTNCHSTTDATLTVNEKLAKLRLEHKRTLTNRQRHDPASFQGTSRQQQDTLLKIDTYWMHPWANLDFTTFERPPSPPRPERPPGPPPPPSWDRQPTPTTPTPTNITYISPQSSASSTVPSLVKCCCRVLGAQIRQPRQHIPTHVKQRLMCEWGPLITDTTMYLFEKTDYDELWLESAQVSLERLVQAFWKVGKVEEIVEAWNDDWEQQEDTTTTLPLVRLEPDQEDIGAWKHLNRIMMILRPSSSSLVTLSSPYLGRTLVSLNISWMTPRGTLSWISFAHLMVSTLPQLKWLYSAGTFDAIQGPQVMAILATGLRRLTLWDLSCHPWLQLEVLIMVDWQRDFRALTNLGLSPLSTNNNKAFHDLLKQHGVSSRININWLE
ncbi:hypothetical protein BC941DRAFT_426553 [Chlamydoabsidia padenii]|nr:hypothetical protein BC941DRAFT_426553 [Chlamydoabsidia padenii]